ncbi:hypothetical protein [Fredinandcohnia sp. 179-A 10B2 NHS]|uniref:hypothetical protein n=1 Tax=Fredinandcohnia sp. 179-A 10B2 NHS TaxID=3235176 RepID=UPI00399F3FCA
MRVNIEVTLNIEDNIMSSGGTFTVNYREYRDNPNLAVAFVADRYIQNIISQTGYRQTDIRKVVYNGDKDITELTKQIRRIPPKDNLPF